MGIHTSIDPFDADEIDAHAAAAADDMLAQVLRDYARERFREANEENRRINGGEYVPYEVWIDGQKIYEGRGAIFPENQISRIRFERTQREKNIELGRKIREILIEWIVGKAQQRVLTTVIRFALNWFDPWSVQMYLEAGDYLRAALKAKHFIPGSREPETRGEHVLQWIAAELVSRSPVESGAYQQAHMLFGDDRELWSALDLSAEEAIPYASEYVFVNSEPYARKIEIGKTRAGRDFVVQVPSRIYERVAEEAAQNFPDVADIRSEWRDAGSLPAPTRSRYKAQRYPAIVIRPR